jgi:hypothetical protein
MQGSSTTYLTDSLITSDFLSFMYFIFGGGGGGGGTILKKILETLAKI